MDGKVIGLWSDGEHRFAKQARERLQIVAGLGVEGDAHAGEKVQHRSRIARDPTAPNLRQVHLIHGELFAEVDEHGFAIAPGQMGENITTQGIDLLGLSRGTRLRLGSNALIEITGLRNPCRQIDENIAPGAMAAMLGRTADGGLIRKAGVMAIVLEDGTVQLDDPIAIVWRPAAFTALEPV